MRLNIPTPCHENWEKMTSNELGRHCLICDKTVVDFSGMSIEDIQNYFLEATESTCGRIKKTQLCQLNRPPAPKITWFRKTKAAILGGLISLFAINQASGQSNVNDSIYHPHKGLVPRLSQSKQQAENVITIKGTVREKESKEVLPFANVFIEGTNRGTITNFDGYFEFEVPRDSIADNTFNLIVSYIGYEEKKIENISTTTDKNELTIEMIEIEMVHVTLGIVVLEDENLNSPPGTTTYSGKMLDMLLRR